jgi:hypothetical protein
VIAAVTAGACIGLISAEWLELVLRSAYLIALYASIGGLISGSVLNGYLPSLFHPTPRNSVMAARLLLRHSFTARLVLIHWGTTIAALLSVAFFIWPLTIVAFIAIAACSVGLVIAICVRLARFSRVAGRTPMYEGLPEHALVAVATAKRLDDGPEWEAVESVTSAARAEAYRQLARGRFLTYRLLAAVIGAAAAAFIGSALVWVFQQPPGLAALVAFAPFMFILAAQFLALMAEQYDSLSGKYAARGLSLLNAGEPGPRTRRRLFGAR